MIVCGASTKTALVFVCFPRRRQRHSVMHISPSTHTPHTHTKPMHSVPSQHRLQNQMRPYGEVREDFCFSLSTKQTCAPSCPGVSTRSSIRCLHSFVLRKLMLTPPSVLLCAVAFTTPPKPAYSYRFLLPVKRLERGSKIM